jgi:hypothetical protein
MATLDGTWRKSTRSNNNGSCVEVRLHGAAIQVRDTKQNGTGPVLVVDPAAWHAFLATVKSGELDQG